MPRYRVLEKSFINESIVEEGEIIELPDSIEAGGNLEALDPPVIESTENQAADQSAEDSTQKTSIKKL